MKANGRRVRLGCEAKEQISITTDCSRKLLILALLLTRVVSSQAEDYLYTINNGRVTITSYTGQGGDVVIPNMIDSLPVASIGTQAFYAPTNVTSVFIPASVVDIGTNAFGNCAGLTNIMISPGVSNIALGAFNACTQLPAVAVPASVTNIDSTAFGWCVRLGAITVDALNPFYRDVDGVLFNTNFTRLLRYPAGRSTSSYRITNSVTSIAPYAFSASVAVTNISIPDSVTNIGFFAFYYCTHLVAMTIPNGVTRIAGNTYHGCEAMKTITIGSGVTNIESQAFDMCWSLAGIYFLGNAPNPDSSMFFSTPPDAMVYRLSAATGWGSMFGGRPTSLWSPELTCAYAVSNGTVKFTKYLGTNLAVAVPSTIDGLPVTRIGTRAFNSTVTNVTMANSVAEIEYSAFQYCYNLERVTLSDGLLNIGNYAFDSCWRLNELTFPPGVTNIGDAALAFCSSLERLYFRGNAPNVSGVAFFGSMLATVYYLPDTSGWGATFGGRPTALWKPRMLTSDDGFGAGTNGFGFNIKWASGMNVAVDACTNPANPVWTPLQTNTLTGDTLYFSDPQWTNHPARFYCLRWP